MSTEPVPHPLNRIGWPLLRPLPDTGPDLHCVRIIAQHRASYEVHDGDKVLPARADGVLVRPGSAPGERPAVGDFALARISANGREAFITALVPRWAELARAAAGEAYQRQLIAANIDHVIVVTALNQDFNLRRLERYLLRIEGSGATAVVVLTKADLYPDSEEAVAEVRRVLGATVQVHALNAKDPIEVEVLRPYLGPGHTAVLVGSSGAGKSTLTNTLLGHELQPTAGIRERDGRGRHTTTHRSLIALPWGSCLIDTPGMRELKLTGEEDLSEGLFADVEALLGQCRFSDCGHGNEPGCRVRASLEAGELDPDRWASYLKLRDERDIARETLAAQIERKSQDKVLTRALNKRLKQKYGRNG